MEHAVALQLVVVLAVGTGLVALCQRFRLSPILGYLATGILVGPSAAGWLPDGPTTQFLAELGAVLLMFTIGLEFSVSELSRMRTMMKRLRSMDDRQEAATFLNDVKAYLDRLASRRIIHKNKAARHKSRLNAHIKAV